MALKSFLIIIGTFFACSVVMVVFVNNFVKPFAEAGKKPLFQGGFTGILAGGAGYLGTVITYNLFGLFWFFAGIFFLLGLVHLFIFHKKYFVAGKDNKSQVLFGEIFFMFALILFVIVVFSSLEYFLRDKEFLFLPMIMCMLPFFLPVLLYYCFDSAYKIPPYEFQYWEYPGDDAEISGNSKEEQLVMTFSVNKMFADTKRKNYIIQNGKNVILGDLFFLFLKSRQAAGKPIEHLDKEGNPFKWGFRIRKKWYQSKCIINPDLSLIENNILVNNVIICERI